MVIKTKVKAKIVRFFIVANSIPKKVPITTARKRIRTTDSNLLKPACIRRWSITNTGLKGKSKVNTRMPQPSLDSGATSLSIAGIMIRSRTK